MRSLRGERGQSCPCFRKFQITKDKSQTKNKNQITNTGFALPCFEFRCLELVCYLSFVIWVFPALASESVAYLHPSQQPVHVRERREMKISDLVPGAFFDR